MTWRGWGSLMATAETGAKILSCERGRRRHPAARGTGWRCPGETRVQPSRPRRQPRRVRCTPCARGGCCGGWRGTGRGRCCRASYRRRDAVLGAGAAGAAGPAVDGAGRTAGAGLRRLPGGAAGQPADRRCAAAADAGAPAVPGAAGGTGARRGGAGAAGACGPGPASPAPAGAGPRCWRPTPAAPPTRPAGSVGKGGPAVSAGGAGRDPGPSSGAWTSWSTCRAARPWWSAPATPTCWRPAPSSTSPRAGWWTW